MTIPLVASIFSLVYFGSNHDAEGYLPWECPLSTPSPPLPQQLLSNPPVLFLISFWGYSDIIYHPLNKAAIANAEVCVVCIHHEEELCRAKWSLGRGKNNSSPTYDEGYCQGKWCFADDDDTWKNTLVHIGKHLGICMQKLLLQQGKMTSSPLGEEQPHAPIHAGGRSAVKQLCQEGP